MFNHYDKIILSIRVGAILLDGFVVLRFLTRLLIRAGKTTRNAEVVFVRYQNLTRG